MKNKSITYTGIDGIYKAGEQLTQFSSETNPSMSEKADKDDKHRFWNTLSLRRNKKNIKNSQVDISKIVFDEKQNNIIQNRSLPKTPIEESDYASISELSLVVNKSDSDSAYASISELSLNIDQNDVSTKSPVHIWDKLTLSSKEVLKNIASNPIYESIKRAIKDSLGKNDYRYILVKFIFDSLAYKEQQENSNYISMNGVKTHATLESLFENMVSIILGDLDDELFQTKIVHSDNSHENDYTPMGSVPIYMNPLNLGLFKKAQEGELKGVQEELSSSTEMALN